MFCTPSSINSLFFFPFPLFENERNEEKRRVEEQWAPSGIWIVKNEQFNKAREKKAGPAIVFDFGLVMGGSCRTATSQKRRLAPGTKPLSFLQQTPNQQFLAVAGKAKELFEFGLLFEWESGPVELFYWWVMGRSPSTAHQQQPKKENFLLLLCCLLWVCLH